MSATQSLGMNPPRRVVISQHVVKSPLQLIDLAHKITHVVPRVGKIAPTGTECLKSVLVIGWRRSLG